jgi:23S rRNA pseudouridine1911/1915/1917 synthase
MKIESDFKSENEYIVTHTVDRNQTGIRLDAFLKERYRKRSRESLKRAIDEGAINLERRQSPHLSVGRLKPSTQLIGGDEVLVVSERKPEPPVNFDYRVLFEDDVLFVIEKPANLPVHPAGRYFFNTLLVHLRTQGHRNPLLKAEREYFLVHRIDKETSGVLVLSKDRAVCANLAQQFADRTTEKRYLAIARGVTPEEFVVDAAMKRSTVSRVELKMMIAPEEDGGQSAQTAFTRLGVYKNASGEFSLVECRPKTGRQHQIRLHLEHAGHPIVGDKLYGMDEDEAYRFFERQFISPEAQAKLLLPRHALHATAIRFEHPITGLRVQFDCPLPADLQEFLTPTKAPTNGGPTPPSAHPQPSETPQDERDSSPLAVHA